MKLRRDVGLLNPPQSEYDSFQENLPVTVTGGAAIATVVSVFLWTIESV
jgi:hypothetical protein